MKAQDGFTLKQIAGEYYAVPSGKRALTSDCALALNETGVFLWTCLAEDTTAETLAAKLAAQYAISYDIAIEDVNKFIKKLGAEHLLIE